MHRGMSGAGVTWILAAIGATVLCACTTSSSGTPTGNFPSNPDGTTASTSQCGTKPGVKATGTPIPLGAIVTDQPGTSFTDIPNMAAAYFACVNANGGINGHPIKFYILSEQTKPAQIAADAHQLVQSDHVVGIVGNTSLLECTIDHSYWEKLGFDVIDSGIAPECYSTPNSAAVNMGPRYSSDGAVQYAIARHVSKIVFDQSTVPGSGYVAAGPAALAARAHIPFVQLTESVPITAGASIALKEVEDAGPNGAVILNFTPPDALVILQAAQRLGLEDRVKLWGCSSPCNTDFVAHALGPRWNHKLFVNAEFAPPDSMNSSAMSLYKAILAQYGSSVTGGVGSFSQMGFTEAEIMVHALKAVKGPYTVRSVNGAIKAVANFSTGMLCQGWTYGSYPEHLPNNMDWTVTPQNGLMVTAQGCTPISSVDPQVAAYRKVAGTAPIAP